MFYDLKCIYWELNQTSVWKLSTAGMKGSFMDFPFITGAYFSQLVLLTTDLTNQFNYDE
jgi:hypothetical protein